MLFGDHDVGFKVVHTVLALASIGLAGALHRVDREVARSAVGGPAGEGPSASSAGDLALGVDR